jgi:PIN domain nuclease of toxin-antitoxin system
MDRAKVVHLDTHVIIWLYEGRVERLGKAARRAIESSSPVASPAAVLELEFLHEIARLKPSATKVMTSLAAEIGLQICDMTFRTVVDRALHETGCIKHGGRDPFDRLIVANAKAASAQLVTKDARILDNYARAIW